MEAGHPVVLEIEVQGARQVATSMPEAVQIFIAPPELSTLKQRLEGRGTDSPDAIARRLEVAQQRRPIRDLAEVLDLQIDARFVRHRQKVHDRVGRAARRHRHR